MVEGKHEKFWLIFHVLLGFGTAVSKFVLIAWVYILVGSTLIQLLKNKHRDFSLIHLVFYSLAIEQLNRSVKGWPLLPYELGKYLSLIVFIVAMLYPNTSKRKSSVGMVFFLLTIPSVLILPDNFVMNDVIFNYTGLLTMALAMIYFAKQEFTFSQFKGLMRTFIYSAIAFTIYLYRYQAKLETKVTYDLAANFDTAGGTATNQVSTYLGLAFAIMVLMYLTRQKLFSTKFVDEALIIFFMFRGLITFSRGGMVSAILAIVVVLLMPKYNNLLQNAQVQFRKISLTTYIYSFLFIIVTFFVVNSITGNQLLLRYQGETQHSLRTGHKDIQSVTSHRYEIFISDLLIFINNPLLGVGVGQSRWYRPMYDPEHFSEYGFLPHVEVSRMLADHGIFGVGMVCIFLFYPFYKVMNEKDNYKRAIMILLFTIAVTSTFHTAMRTILAPIFFGLACVNLVPDPPFNPEHARNKSKRKKEKASKRTPALA